MRDLLTDMLATLQALQKHRIDIEQALWYGDNNYTFDDIVLRVVSGELDVYKFDKSVVIAHVDEASQHKTYHLYIAAGNLAELLQQGDLFDREARLRGCKYLSIAGRRGWERPLKKLGWTHKLSILKKEVSNGRTTDKRAKEHARNRPDAAGRERGVAQPI